MGNATVRSLGRQTTAGWPNATSIRGVNSTAPMASPCHQDHQVNMASAEGTTPAQTNTGTDTLALNRCPTGTHTSSNITIARGLSSSAKAPAQRRANQAVTKAWAAAPMGDTSRVQFPPGKPA